MSIYRLAAVVVVTMGFVLSACSSSGQEDSSPTDGSVDQVDLAPAREGIAIPPAESALSRNQVGYEFPSPPPVLDGELAEELSDALDVVFGSYEAGIEPPVETFDVIGASGDVRPRGC